MKNFRYLTFLLLIAGFSFGQVSEKSDNLFNDLKNQKDDTLKVKTLLNISNNYSLSDAIKSLEYAEEALELSEKLKWNTGIAWSYFRISYAYTNQGNFSSALTYRMKELQKWEELHNKKNVCITLGNIGISYSDMGNHLKAMEYYILSLKLSKEIGNTIQTINNLCNIASIYKEQANYKKAFEYYFQSLKLAEDNKDEKSVAICQGNIGSIYAEQHNYSKALESYLIAYEIDKQLGNKGNISSWVANIGELYQRQGDSARKAGNNIISEAKNARSLEYYFVALKYTGELGNKYLQAFVLGNIGNIYTSKDQYKIAEEYLQKSIEIAAEINSVEILMDGHQRLYNLYRKKHDKEKALNHYEKFIEIRDSLYSVDNKKAVSELQIKFDTEKKEAENKSLIQENKLQFLTIRQNRIIVVACCSVIALLFCLGFLINRQNKLKSKQIAVQFEQKLLRTQMNPHFIFNSLASIESFIYDHQPKEAGVYLSSFSRLMRLILENSAAEYITLEKEIETLNYYLTLQKMRLDDNLSYTIETGKEINPEHINLPPMLTQPFIENAIEHGFRGSKTQGEIKIFFNVIDDNLQVQIIDNGIGIEKAQKQKDVYKTHKSMAMQITSERLTFLNRSKRKKLSFAISDISNEEIGKTGTRITFLIPVST